MYQFLLVQYLVVCLYVSYSVDFLSLPLAALCVICSLVLTLVFVYLGLLQQSI